MSDEWMDEMFTKANARDQEEHTAVEEHRRKRAELMAAMPAFSDDLKQRLVDIVATYNEKAKAAGRGELTEVRLVPGRMFVIEKHTQPAGKFAVHIDATNPTLLRMESEPAPMLGDTFGLMVEDGQVVILDGGRIVPPDEWATRLLKPFFELVT